jgi:hypothetical protein
VEIVGTKKTSMMNPEFKKWLEIQVYDLIKNRDMNWSWAVTKSKTYHIVYNFNWDEITYIVNMNAI